MRNLYTLFCIVLTVGLGLGANALGAIWAQNSNKFSWSFFLILIVSPLIFLVYGLVTQRLGVSISSGVIDALITATTVIMGLWAFKEWGQVSPLQFIGLALAITGIFLMLYFQKQVDS